ncbi:MAG: proprotein convertase P-domain-containing protein, partial [Pirellula sp.]
MVSGGQNTTTYSNNIPVPINDFAISNSLIDVPTPGSTIQDINTLINLTHTFDADLAISLIAPDGTRILLSGNWGLDGDNYSNTIFDDSASTPISAGSPPFRGAFQPDQPL